MAICGQGFPDPGPEGDFPEICGFEKNGKTICLRAGGFLFSAFLTPTKQRENTNAAIHTGQNASFVSELQKMLVDKINNIIVYY